MKRILITGCNGLLGQKLLHVLTQNNIELLGIDLAQTGFIKDVYYRYYNLDLTARKPTISLIQDLKPNVIIHTAAITNVDECEFEKEKCWCINVTGTDNIVTGASRIGAKVIFISSDYIFDGKAGPYNENDMPNPLNYYGRSKLAAENIVRGSSVPWSIIRTIVLYGIGIDVKESFVTWLLGMLRKGKDVQIVNDQWGNTTLVDDLAFGIERIISLKRTGIFHIGGRDYMTRYEFALRVAEEFNLDKNLISPISTAKLKQAAPRPLKSGLKIDKAEIELNISFQNVEKSLTIYNKQENTKK